MSITVFSGYKVLKLGSHGSSVRQLQRDINRRLEQLEMIDAIAVLVDGRFGPETRLATKYLQCVSGRPVDGAVDNHTSDFITQGSTGLVVLSQGSFGTGVMAVQQAVLDVQVRVSKDGQFGPLTARGVKIFQQKAGLLADGIVGVQTWEKVVRSRLTGLPCTALLPHPYR